ncbi:hypothetical protein [Tsukamurella tyrosinosolvens]|uniref:hypothetical protein n=1 Tax=Tsukamurella tyrosinosolvens TaxID=57704 RepID=UPI003F49BF48
MFAYATTRVDHDAAETPSALTPAQQRRADGLRALITHPNTSQAEGLAALRRYRALTGKSVPVILWGWRTTGTERFEVTPSEGWIAVTLNGAPFFETACPGATSEVTESSAQAVCTQLFLLGMALEVGEGRRLFATWVPRTMAVAA